MFVQQNVVASGGAATCFFSQDKDRSCILPEEASSANYISSAVSEPAGFIDLAVGTSLLSTNVCEVLFPSFLCGLTQGRWTMYVAGTGFPVYPGLRSCTKG